MYVPQPRTREFCPNKHETIDEPKGCDDPASWVALKAVASLQFAPLTMQWVHTDGSVESRSATVSRLHLGASWSRYRRFQLSVNLPLNIYQTDFASYPGGYGAVGNARIGIKPDFFDTGDLRIGVRANYFSSGFWDGALQLFVFVPTGDHERLTGDGYARADLLGIVGTNDDPRSYINVSFYAGGGFRSNPFTSGYRFGFKGGGAVSIDTWDIIHPMLEARIAELWTDKLFPNTAFPMDISGGVRIQPQSRRTWWLTWVATTGTYYTPGIPKFGMALDVTVIPWTI
jgi:hypothetical protein